MTKRALPSAYVKKVSACNHKKEMKCMSRERNVQPAVCFSRPAAYITHDATQPLSDITAVYQIACSFLWSHENLYPTFFHTCSRTPQKPVNTLKYVKLVEFPFNRKCPCLYSTTSHKEILYFLNYIHVTAVVSYFASIMLRYRQGRIMPKALCVAAGCLVVLLAFTL